MRKWFAAVAELLATRPTRAVRLLPGFDQYVLGPGTDDPHVVPTTRRRAVRQQSGWIAPIVVAGGVVSGTWKIAAENIQVSWFAEAGTVPRSALRVEVERLSTILGRDLGLVVA